MFSCVEPKERGLSPMLPRSTALDHCDPATSSQLEAQGTAKALWKISKTRNYSTKAA